MHKKNSRFQAFSKLPSILERILVTALLQPPHVIPTLNETVFVMMYKLFSVAIPMHTYQQHCVPNRNNISRVKSLNLHPLGIC